MDLPFLGGANPGRSSNVSPETCINYFYEKGASGESLVSTHGATVFKDVGDGEVRGGIKYNELAYFVIDNTLYELDSAGNSTSRGTINTSSGRVSIAHNGVRTGANQQIMIVDGSDGWIYNNVTSTLGQITDVDFTDSFSVVFLDGYFVFAQRDSDRFWITSLYDGTTISPSDFATAEGDPDEILSLIADQRELFIFGKDTLEIWYNSGDSDNTFQRYTGGFKQTGCVAKFTPARINNNVFWLSQNERGFGQVVMLGQNYVPEIVSTPELDYQISTYSKIDDAFAYAYQHEGHEFYVITFPTAGITWVYDASIQDRSKAWHTRGHTIDNVFPNRERYNVHVFAFGKHLFGDMSNGTIYQLDASVGTIDGTRIPRERIGPNLNKDNRRIRISSLQLDMGEGIGDPNVATDTSMWMSWSKDGGHTYSEEIDRSAGEVGEYKKRLKWRRLGHGRDWTFRLRTWVPHPHIVKGLTARLYGETRDPQKP